MITRKADARWEGELKTGSGHIRLASGAFEGKFSFGTRFEGAPGTNPEELLAGAHAACFSMAFNLMLSLAGHSAQSVATTAEVQMERVGAAMEIIGITLTTVAEVPGIGADDFQTIAENAKTNCIVSKALKAVPITLKATLAPA